MYVVCFPKLNYNPPEGRDFVYCYSWLNEWMNLDFSQVSDETLGPCGEVDEV